MSAIRTHTVMYTSGCLSVSIGGEVIWIAPGNYVVTLEICVRHHMVKISLEQRHLCNKSSSIAVAIQSLR